MVFLLANKRLRTIALLCPPFLWTIVVVLFLPQPVQVRPDLACLTVLLSSSAQVQRRNSRCSSVIHRFRLATFETQLYRRRTRKSL